MKIFIGDNGNVDIDGPIEADEEQMQKVIAFFKSIYRESVVEIDDSSEFRTERIGEKLFQKSWSVPEYAALLDLDKDTDELAEELGRTWMSVDIQRGQWIPRLLSWAEENNKNLVKGNIKDIVKEYIEYLDKQRQLKKEQRKEHDLKIKRLEKEKKRLEKKLEGQRLLKRAHLEENIDEIINDTLKRIEEIKEKLNKYCGETK